MNRRDALKLAGLALALPAASVVQANEPFQIIEPAQKADDPSKIEVLEFFQSLDVPIREVYGQSEDCGPTSFNMPGATKLGDAWVRT